MNGRVSWHDLCRCQPRSEMDSAEDYSENARALYRACVQAHERLVAPPLLPIEVANVLRQRMRRGQPQLSLAEATELLQQFLTMPLESASPPGLYDLAMKLADAHNLPAVYDAHYVALAQLLGCNLWTADERLVNSLGGKLPFVKWIGDYNEGNPL